MLKAAESVMKWWLRSTPEWMQPRVFWTVYFRVLDKYVRESR